MSAPLVCMACYQNRLASVFENATDFRLFEHRDGALQPAGNLSLPTSPFMDTTSAILACGVGHVVCGAICTSTQKELEDKGLQLTPWVRGRVDEIRRAWETDSMEGMLMPGRSPSGG